MKYAHRIATLQGLFACCLFAAGVALGVPAISHASFGVVDPSYLITLSQSPNNPAPNTVVSYSLASGFISLSRATIVWYVDGKQVASGIGQTTFSTTSGASGSTHAIQVVVEGADGTRASANATLHPSAVRILYEAASYTPSLFRGRALPSGSSSVKFHTEIGVGDPLTTEYTWFVDGTRVASLSGLGKSDSILVMPPYSGMTVSVSTRDTKSGALGSGTVRLNLAKPNLILYPDDPIGGVQYHRALSTTDTIPSQWNTLRLEPYYTPIQTANNSSLTYRWSINGEAAAWTAQDVELPAELLRATLSVSLSRFGKVLADAQKTWNMTILPSSTTGGAFAPNTQ